MRKENETVSRPIVITLRRAMMEDATLLFQWRNDPDVRTVSASPKAITMRDHSKWLAERISLTHPESIWMIINSSDDSSIGSARILLDGKQYARISIVVASDFRGQGIGRKAIKQLTEKVFGMNRTAEARVHVKNLISLRAFLATGFHIVPPVETQRSFLTLQAEPPA